MNHTLAPSLHNAHSNLITQKWTEFFLNSSFQIWLKSQKTSSPLRSTTPSDKSYMPSRIRSVSFWSVFGKWTLSTTIVLCVSLEGFWSPSASRPPIFLHSVAKQSFELCSSPVKTVLDSWRIWTLLAKLENSWSRLLRHPLERSCKKIVSSSAVSVNCIVIKHANTSNVLPQCAHHIPVIFLICRLSKWLSSTKNQTESHVATCLHLPQQHKIADAGSTNC